MIGLRMSGMDHSWFFMFSRVCWKGNIIGELKTWDSVRDGNKNRAARTDWIAE
jgi:hypothetical protein